MSSYQYNTAWAILLIILIIDLKASTLLKNRLFLLNFVKFLETNFSIEPIHGAAVGLSFVNARKTSTKELV